VLRKDNFEKTEKLRELQASLNQANASNRVDISVARDREAQLVARHADTVRQLEQRVLQLQNADVTQLTQRLKTMTDQRNVLQRQMEALQGPLPAGPCLYELLLSMATCMNRMGKEEEDTGSVFLPFEPRPTFQDHVHRLVKKCLEGDGLGVRELGERQTRVFGLLNPVYAAAAQRGEHVEFVTRVSAGMVKTGGGKRKKKEFDEFGRMF
jgi:hypothetical protein